MQIDRVRRVADGAENGALVHIGIAEHVERLVAVGGDDDVIVGRLLAVAVMDDDAVRRPLDRGDGAAESELVAEGGGQFLDVVLAAALHRAPDRTVILQQAMVREEGNEIFGGKIQHLGGRRRPDCRTHRREIIGQQPRREMTPAKIFAERKPGQSARGMVFDALGVEGQDVAEHP